MCPEAALAGGGAGAERLVQAPGWGLATRPRFFPPVLELGAIPAARAHQRRRGRFYPCVLLQRVLQVTFQENWKL